jgi:hypothetical protein
LTRHASKTVQTCKRKTGIKKENTTYVNLAENASAKNPVSLAFGRLLDVNLIKLAMQG